NNMIKFIHGKFIKVIGIYAGSIKLFSRNAKLFLAGSFFVGMGFSGFSLLFNLYLKSISIDETGIGHIITATTMGTLLMAIPASILIRKISIKKILLLSTPVTIFTYFIQVMGFNYNMIITGGILSGVFTVFFQIAAAPFFMRNSTPKERPYLFSMNFGAQLIAGVLGSVIGGLLPGMIAKFGLVPHVTYRYTLFIFGGLVLAALLPYLLIKESSEKEVKNDRFKFKTEKKVIVRLFLPNLVTGLGAGLSIPFINLYFDEVFSASTKLIGAVFAGSQFLMISGILLAPLLSEKFGKIKTVVSSQLISIPFLIIMGITGNFYFAVIAFLVRAALMNMAQPLFTNYAMEKVHKDEQPLTNALLVIAWTAGRGVSASIGGFLIERFSYALPFFTTSALYLVSSLLILIFFEIKPKRKASSVTTT
ncbi:MFS transporter, partial [candidate division WOR-3 bacterium]|nr:MFS transporter [candidate division WOR-3 bacterium]